MTIAQLVENSRTPLAAAQFLWHEIPKRFATRVYLLSHLGGGTPSGIETMALREIPEIDSVINAYVRSFKEMRCLPCPQQESDILEMKKTLNSFRQRHKDAQAYIMIGLHKLLSSLENNREGQDLTNQLLIEYYRSRIDTEMLTRQFTAAMSDSPPESQSSQYLALAGVKSTPRPEQKRKFGVLTRGCNVKQVIQHAAWAVKRASEKVYGFAPQVEVTELAFEKDSFAYVETYLYYIICELLKNAMRATIEAVRVSSIDDTIPCSLVPPIQVAISGSDDGVVVKITDQGVGFPWSRREKIWDFLYSNAPPVIHNAGIFKHRNETALLEEQPMALGLQMLQRQASSGDRLVVTPKDEKGPLAGYGVGLPLSRLYARYLGGDLQIQSVPRVGTDAYLFLRSIQDK